MAIWVVATAAGGYVTGFVSLFVARMFVGVGEAALSPAAYSMLADYFPPERRARAMSIYTSGRSEEHTSELQSPCNLVCRLLLEKKKKITTQSLRSAIHHTRSASVFHMDL